MAETSDTAAQTAVLEASDVDYGAMYVVQKKQAREHKWETSVGYTYGFSNPYRGEHGFTFALDHRIGQYFSLGVSPIYYLNTQKDVARRLTTELSAQRIDTLVYEPKYGGYINGKFAPLAGLLNVMNKGAVNFELMLEAGVGAMWYQQTSGAMPSVRLAITPHVLFSNNLGLSFGVISYFDRFSDGDVQNRIDTAISFVAGF
jgi:hypothetical protein